MPEPLFPVGRGAPGPRDPEAARAERALRRTLATGAAAVDPGPAPRVGELVGGAVDRRPPRRWPAALGVAAAVAVLAVASGVALRPDDATAPVAVPSPGPSPAATTEQPTGPVPSAPAEPTAAPSASSGPSTGTSSTPEPSAPPPATASGTVVVWASVLEPRSQSGRLVPERRAVDLPVGAGTAERVQAALTVLLSSPPADPDHYSGWWWDAAQTGTAPWDGQSGLTVELRADGTTVDLPAEATRAPLGSTGVLTAVDELVRTVVTNGGTAPVTVLVEGGPAELWGQVRLEEPVSADPDLLTGGWILDPYEGQRLAAGTVTLSGSATAFEANVLWSVLDEDGAVVAQGFTMAGSDELGPWSVPVELGPGTYTAVLEAPDMAGPEEGGTGGSVWRETTTFTVVN